MGIFLTPEQMQERHEEQIHEYALDLMMQIQEAMVPTNRQGDLYTITLHGEQSTEVLNVVGQVLKENHRWDMSYQWQANYDTGIADFLHITLEPIYAPKEGQ